MSAVVAPGVNSMRKGGLVSSENIGASSGNTTPLYTVDRVRVDGKTTPPTCGVSPPKPLQIGSAPQQSLGKSSVAQNNMLWQNSFADGGAAQSLQLQYLLHYQQQLQLQVEQQACLLRSNPYLFSTPMGAIASNQFSNGNQMMGYNMLNITNPCVPNMYNRNMITQHPPVQVESNVNVQGMSASSVQPPSNAVSAKKPSVPDYDRVNSPIAKIVGLELRKGKWSEEEKLYAMRIMSAFREGKLPDRFGVRPTHTLRTFIARWLHCDAMRITKKFAGADSTGKHVYRRDMEMTSEEKKKVSQQISMLEKKFIQKLLAVQKSRAKRHAKGKRKRGKSSAVQSAHAVGMVGAAPFRGEVSMVTNPYVQLQHKQAVLQPGGVKRVMSEQTSMVTKKQKKKKPEKKKTTYSKEIGGTPKTSSIRAKEPSHTQQSPTDLQEPLAKRQKPTKNMSSRIGTPEKVPDEPSKVDGAAGLLMLFANESPSPATK